MFSLSMQWRPAGGAEARTLVTLHPAVTDVLAVSTTHDSPQYKKLSDWQLQSHVLRYRTSHFAVFIAAHNTCYRMVAVTLDTEWWRWHTWYRMVAVTHLIQNGGGDTQHLLQNDGSDTQHLLQNGGGDTQTFYRMVAVTHNTCHRMVAVTHNTC